MKVALTVLAFSALGLSGCKASVGEYQARTAATTGCPAPSITIEGAKVTKRTSSWTATCQGKTYYCAGDDMLKNVACSEAKPK